MAKSILFIGGAGFIGSSLVKKFVEEQTYNLFVLEPEKASIQRLESYEDKVVILRGDLRDSLFVEKILKKQKIDIVMHLVSALLPDSTFEDYQNEMNDLMLPSMNLMKMCSELEIKFVFFSSGGAIYGNSETGLHKEDDKLEPISYYGLSKCVMEEAIRFESHRAGLKYLILRPSNPFGKGQNLYGRQGLIAVALGKILKNEPITIWGDGKSIRDYIYIDDLADCVYLLISKHIKNRTINIGSGIGYSVNDIIEFICEYVKGNVKVEYVGKRSVDVSAVVMDTHQLYDTIKFKASDIKACIGKFVNETMIK